MRLLICDDHVVFAESLACVLSAGGKEVVGVTHSPGQLVEVLRGRSVDVCLLDVRFGRETAFERLADVRAVSPCTRIVLLTADVDEAVLAAGRAGGVDAIAEKTQPLKDTINVLDRVYAGQSVMPSGVPAAPEKPDSGRRASDTVRHLAGFLTPRERQVLSGLVRGDDTTMLARSLGISSATARCHVQKVLTKLGAHSRLEAATTAVQQGMIDPRTGAWLVPRDRPERTRRRVPYRSARRRVRTECD